MIDHARGKALADQYGIKFFETSAKSASNVEDAFLTLASDVITRLETAVPEDKVETDTQKNKNLKVGPKPPVNKTNCMCANRTNVHKILPWVMSRSKF